MAKQLSFEEFSARVERAYNGRISVVKETYVNTRHKVTAYCKIHKVYFEVEEARSLTRHFAECPECKKERFKQVGENNKKPWKEVLKSFRDKYGDKFTYDESTYNDMRCEMKVRCNDCGSEFEITPTHHLKYINGGCPICHKHKTRTCSKCGKVFEVDRHYPDSTEFICKECRKEIKRINDREYRLRNKKSLKPRKRRTRCIYSEEKHQYELERRRNLRENKLYTCPCCGQTHKYKEKCLTSDLCRRHPQRKWYKILIPFGFDYSKLGTPEYVDEYYKALDVIKTEYYGNKLSPRQIYEKYNCQKYFKYDTSIRHILKSEHLEIRNLSEAQHNAIDTGVLKMDIYSRQFNIERHISWDDKTFLLRSGYESDYANILDELKIIYEVEPFRIRYYDTYELKERIAIPDFYLPETNTIVEVKSSWTLNKQNMIDKREAYLKLGYNFKLWYEHEYVDLDTIPNNLHNIVSFMRNNKND